MSDTIKNQWVKAEKYDQFRTRLAEAEGLLRLSNEALDCLCGCQCTCPEPGCPICGVKLEGSHKDFYQEKCPVCKAHELRQKIDFFFTIEGAKKEGK